MLTAALPAAAQDPVFGGDELKKAWTDKELMGDGSEATRIHNVR